MDLTNAYRSIYERLLDTASDLDAEDIDRTVLPTPDWSVKDTYAHLVGAIVDVIDGNLDGIGTDAWTAAHVDARRDQTLAAVCDEWAGAVDDFVALLSTTGRDFIRLVSGSWTHEQDIRGSLGLRGVGDTGGMLAALDLVEDIGARLDQAGVDGLRVVTPERTWSIGSPTAATLTTTAYVLARLMYGRRSLAQVAALDWEGDAATYLPHLSAYGPAAVTIHD